MPEPVSIALGLYLAGYAAMRSYSRPDSAVSEEAQIVRREARCVGDRAEVSEALFGPKARALGALAGLATESAAPNWDGYGAKPVDPWALQSAEKLIRALPEGFPVPEIGVEPDGSVSLDWIHSRYRLLSVSVAANSRLAYAWIDGTDKGHAAAGYDGARLPDRLLQEIGRIMSEPRASLRAA